MGKYEDLLTAVGRAAPPPKYIRAYHGSPHSFDRFDASKIGSTEGTAYGFGHYFSRDADVAREYRDEYREAIQRAVSPELVQGHADAMRRMMEAQEMARKAPPSQWDIARRTADEAEAAFYQMQHRIAEESHNPGALYEVEIAHPESALLDLDVPLSGDHKAAVLSAAFNAPDNKWQRMSIEEAASPRTPAKVALESLMRAYNVVEPNRMAGRLPSQAKVSQSLFERGIPGARYEDTIGRYSERGSQNYVMFPGTEDSIRILRKYGLLAPMAAGAMGEQE
jgi:hypothetical protein